MEWVCQSGQSFISESKIICTICKLFWCKLFWCRLWLINQEADYEIWIIIFNFCFYNWLTIIMKALKVLNPRCHDWRWNAAYQHTHTKHYRVLALLRIIGISHYYDTILWWYSCSVHMHCHESILDWIASFF